jgi:flavin-dependent dehydrogenase
MRVAVVGSGPTGCAAAIALCRAGCRVVMIGDGRDGVGEEVHPAARPASVRSIRGARRRRRPRR